MSWNQSLMEEAFKDLNILVYRLKTKKWVRAHPSMEAGSPENDQLVMKLVVARGEWFWVSGTWYQVGGVDGLTAYEGYFNAYSVCYLPPHLCKDWKLPKPETIFKKKLRPALTKQSIGLNGNGIFGAGD